MRPTEQHRRHLECIDLATAVPDDFFVAAACASAASWRKPAVACDHRFKISSRAGEGRCSSETVLVRAGSPAERLSLARARLAAR